MTNGNIREQQRLLEQPEIIPLHFDVPYHHLPLNQFIEAAKSTQDIINDFNNEFFDGKLKYQILVIPPKDGTFLELLGLITSGAAASAWAFFSTDIGKAYIKGLTGHEPAHWAEIAGKKTKEFIENEDAGKKKKDIKNPDDTEKLLESSVEDQMSVSVIVVQITLGFLKKEPDDLQKIGLSKAKFRKAYTAKNKIYQDCIDNPEIEGLGFDTEPEFPIRRKDFPTHIVEVPKEVEVEDNPIWKVEVKDIKVHSPNWDRDGRKWQARTSAEKEVWFSIEDDLFWHHVKIKDIQPDINDNMKVQWAYPADMPKRANVRVLKVLTYNEKEISQPYLEEELSQMLEELSVDEDDEPDLFNRDTTRNNDDDKAGND